MPHPKTLVEAFQRTAAEIPEAVALRTPGGAQSYTWAEYAEKVERTARALHRLGLRRGDRVALMLTNRPEFHIVDTAALHLGAIPFSIYNTSAPEQIAYVIGHAGPKIAIAERQFIARITEGGAASLDHLIDVADLDALEPDAEFDFAAAWRAADPDAVITLIYTSGTTGPPKGVETTHRAALANAEALARGGYEVRRGDRVTSYLPSAHAVDRMASHWMQMVHGTVVTSVADLTQILGALTEVRPTVWAAVPRVWEKMKNGIQALIAGADEEKRKGAEWAFDVGLRKVRLEQAGEPVPAELAGEYELADQLVFATIRQLLGLDEMRYAFSGAAAAPRETLEFFLALGLEIVEAWGMTEATSVAIANPIGASRVGTVGKPLPGLEVRLAEDSELLVRGPWVMKGYRNDPDKTAETIDPEGWLHTGDVATIDADGYVTLVDRKKELIINAAGKNMSPSNIENTLRAQSPLLGGIIVVGEGRPYNVALFSLDPDAAAAFAAQHGLPNDPSVLAKEPVLIKAVQDGVDKANARLSRVEQIKKFAVVSGFWEPGGDELTPTMKLRRKPIHTKYAEEIEALYA
ncbi:long-chain fatty acid--CoA ligase [Actinocorallia sp. API 0066]|uniref:AMP-dependent synthetase/ligase n=1 Tax=Actinocorallia sp. API 0066 TaxID=2896846 RepID=UPI001E41B322|nr:long-chain fatty acid--CoA ligase [Actinocorallia sp. API 0066]MCD0448349.1 long-chain fatty acid--CoA ligase [Actinocorallia sp. API 0066]